jgi:O-6-methylguanine DNA methyltransferase
VNRRLIDDLATLRTDAPPELLPGVLAGVGLADRYVVRQSVIGPVAVAVNRHGVSCIDVADDAFEERFAARFGRPALPAGRLPERLLGAIDRALHDGRPGSLDLDLRSLSPFRRAVLRKAAEIPRSEVRSYGWVAREVGSPGAVRAVGSALAANPVPLVVPCHRVVRSDGRFGNYSLGSPANKRRLLEAEGIDTTAHEALAARGIRFVGSDTTGVFCLPTCRHARRITTAHRIEFRNEAAAQAAGYRPCATCRPAAA